MGLFRPFIEIMKPLKYEHQFSFLGAILVIPILFMSCIFVIDTNKDLAVMEERLTGAVYNQHLKNLLRDVQQYRGLTIGHLNGDTSQQSTRLELEKKIEQDFKVIELYIRENQTYISSSRMVIHLKEEWQNILLSGNVDQRSMMTRHTEFISTILDMMIHMADESNLFITKANDTYYMVQDVVKTLPRLTEQLGQIRAIGTAITARGEINIQDTSTLYSLLTPVKQSITELEHGKNVLIQSQPEFNTLFDQTQEVVNEIDLFLDFVQREIIGEQHINLETKDFFNEATTSIETSFDLYDQETLVLSQLLEQQIDTLKWSRNLMLVLIVVAISLTLYGFLGFFFSIRTSMDELTTAGYLFFYRYLYSPQIQKVEKQRQITEGKLKKVKGELSQRVMQAQEDERKRIARELHDGVGQLLYAMLIRLTILENAQTDKERKEHLQYVKKGISNSMKEIKGIAQSLRPGSLDALGLVPALQSFISEYEKTYGIGVHFNCSHDRERFLSTVETALYRICQEALTNIAKHSQADFVELVIDMNDGVIDLTIQDNGIGFSVEEYFSQHDKKGIGLLSIEERVNALGGALKIKSDANEGTKLSISIPNENL